MTTASANPNMTKVPHNSAPALSADLQTLYVAVSNGNSGYLVALDSTTLAPLTRVLLTDPKSGLSAILSDNGSASPTVGTDGDVYFGVLDNPFGSNHRRGWLLHFNGKSVAIENAGRVRLGHHFEPRPGADGPLLPGPIGVSPDDEIQPLPRARRRWA